MQSGYLWSVSVVLALFYVLERKENRSLIYQRSFWNSEGIVIMKWNKSYRQCLIGM